MMETPTRKVYQSGQKVEISGHYEVTGCQCTDPNELIAAPQEHALQYGDLFPNYKGRATCFTLIETDLSHDTTHQRTDYSMPWQT